MNQLYDMIKCRHGLMLVGPAYGAKSSLHKVLKDVVTDFAKGGRELPVKTTIINPKAITSDQLYGYSDPISKEFTDGVLARHF